jgi:L-alanine-DL-glutamate epimerase-like enolase superfamily enzyme
MEDQPMQDISSQPMRFSRAVLYSFAPIKLPVPFQDSTSGLFDSIPLECWLQLTDQDGVTGQCPCSYEMGRIILPLIMTGEKRTYEEWYKRVYWAVRNRGFSGESIVELGRLDLALHDILAKRAGLPMHRFFGATRDWVNVYASGMGTNLTWKQMVEETEGFIRDGYTTFKMKIATDFGSSLDHDLKRISEVRRMIGDKAELAIDANQLWKADDALRFIERAKEHNLAWFEEPVHSHDIEELEKLTKVCPVDVAMGESMRNHYLFYAYAQAGVRHLQPVASNLGGVRDWMAVRDLAVKRGLRLTSGGFSHITASYVATAPEDTMVEYLYPIMRYFWELMDIRPEEKDGKFFLPAEPGLCVSPDFKALEKMDKIQTKQYFYPDAQAAAAFLGRYGVKQ